MPVVTNVVEIVVGGTVPTTGSGTKNIYNVFHYRLTTSPPGPSAAAVGAAFLVGAWPNIAAALSVLYTGVFTNCRYLDDATQQYASGGVPASGATVGARLPTSTTVAFLLRCFTRGKNFRGRKLFAPIAESHQLNDELSAAGLTAWQACIAPLGNVISPVGGSNFTPCVVSKSLSQLRTNPTSIVASDVQTVLLNKTLGTLRRRKEKTVR